MVVLVPLSGSIYLGIYRGSRSNRFESNEAKRKRSRVFSFGVESRKLSSRASRQLRQAECLVLTCVACGRGWRGRNSGENWSLTTASLAEHTYRSARESLIEAEDQSSNFEEYKENGDKERSTAGNKPTDEDSVVDSSSLQESQQQASSSSLDASSSSSSRRESQESSDYEQTGGSSSGGFVDCRRENIAVVSTSSSWDSCGSSRVFATSRFGVLLGMVVMVFTTVTLAGVAFVRWWKELRGSRRVDERRSRDWSVAPTGLESPSAFSFFLKKDLKRKESVEWVNMILGKLWKVYRRGLESWLVGLLQPLIDNLQKPSYVRRVEIQDFYLGDEPLSVRSVERRTSRRADDLQYQIGLRYTGEAKMLLAITLNAGFVPVMIPVGVRGLDVDGEIWVKLRLIPSEPWVGTATWAFVSLPKIILALSPFRLMNIMTIPFVSRFLTKLLTEDLPRLFVKPNKIVINFLNNPAMNPFAIQFRDEAVNVDNNKDFAGELSVTLVDARKLKYFPIGKTDPYVVLTLGDQEIRSKKNSQTSIIGPPGAPIWNQDFQLLVTDPVNQKLSIRVRDVVGLGLFTVGYGEVDLSTLQDTVPTDKIVPLRGGWGFSRRFSGEIMLRLTYKAYVDDEEDEDDRPLTTSDSDSDSEKDDFSSRKYYGNKGKIGFLNDLFSAVNTVIRDLGYENIRVVRKQPNGKPDHGKASAAATGNSPAQWNGKPASSNTSDGKRNDESDDDDDDDASVNTTRLAEVGVAVQEASTRRKLSQSSALLWLSLATGLALITAASLNFSHLIQF